MIFTANDDGIYYNNKSNTEGVSMINTVEDKRKNCTQLQYKRANIARELYQTVGHT